MTNRSSVTMFGIETIGQYLALCEEAVSDLAAKQDNVLKGFSAILALNHIPDWLEHKASEAQLACVGIVLDGDTRKKRDHIEAANSDLRLVRQIANGFKHLKPVHPTGQIAGYGHGPFGVGPYGQPYLLIDLGAEKELSQRWLVCLDLCQRTLRWWQETLSQIVLVEDA